MHIIALTHSYHPRRTITATASTTEKLDWLLSLPAGATHVANYKKENFVEVTNAATGGKGVDLIVDMVGQAHFSRNLDALATDGRMTMLSLISGSPKFDTVQYGTETRT
jgi:NADPH:quinone reductase-like Zn-dependent oxidoreductase